MTQVVQGASSVLNLSSVGGGPNPPPDPPESFQVRQARLKKHLANADIGPTLAVGEILAMSGSWALYEADAEGKSFKQWLRTITTRELHWWTILADAVTAITRRRAIQMSYRAVRWVKSIPLEYRDAVLTGIGHKYREQNQTPVTYAQAVLIRDTVMPKKRRVKKVCAKCEDRETAIIALRAQVEGLGKKPVA